MDGVMDNVLAAAMNAQRRADGIVLNSPLLRTQYFQTCLADDVFRHAWWQYTLLQRNGAPPPHDAVGRVRVRALALLMAVEWLELLSNTDVEPHVQMARALLVDSLHAAELSVTDLGPRDPILGDDVCAMAADKPLFGDSSRPPMEQSWPSQTNELLSKNARLDLGDRKELQEASERICTLREDARRAIDEACQAARRVTTAPPPALLRPHASSLALVHAVIEECGRSKEFAEATTRHAAARSAAQKLDNETCRAMGQRLRTRASHAPMLELPSEILDLIFALLSPFDAAMLRRVRSRFAKSALGRARAPHLEIIDCSTRSRQSEFDARQFYTIPGVEWPVVSTGAQLTLRVVLVTRLPRDAPAGAPLGPFRAPGPYQQPPHPEKAFETKSYATYPFDFLNSKTDHPPNTVAYPIAVGWLCKDLNMRSKSVEMFIVDEHGKEVDMRQFAIRQQPLAKTYPQLPLSSLRNNPVDGAACHSCTHYNLGGNGSASSFRSGHDNGHSYKFVARVALEGYTPTPLVMTANTLSFVLRKRGNNPRKNARKNDEDVGDADAQL